MKLNITFNLLHSDPKLTQTFYPQIDRFSHLECAQSLSSNH